ncbi:putative membrane protein, partial [Chlamydia psittaci 06-1683]
MKKLWLTL